MLNTEVQEAIRMVEIMHYGLFPAILIIGTKFFLETAKKILYSETIMKLMSYIIGTSILMLMFFTVFTNEPLMNFSFE